MTPDYAKRVFSFQRAVGFGKNFALTSFEEQSTYREHHSLIVSRAIDIYLFENLKIAASIYLAANAQMPYCTTLSPVISEYLRDSPECLTENGSVIPKQHAALEYNLFCKAFFRLIESLNIDHSFIESWTLPLNLRIRRGNTSNDKERENPLSPAQPHSDSWLNECPDAGTAMLPIWGDVDNNNVEFFVPDQEKFDNSWITDITSYAEGQKNLDKYWSIGHNILDEGWVTFSDFATAHASNIVKSPCGPRLSIDTVFGIQQKERSYKKWRSRRVQLHNMLEIGGDLRDKLADFGTFLMPQTKIGEHKDGKQGLVPAGDVYPYTIVDPRANYIE